jgi:hypothetical protein
VTTVTTPPNPPRENVRGLLAIALAWTVVVSVVVAVHPTAANGSGATVHFGQMSFRIVSIGGLTPDQPGDGTYTVHQDPVAIVVELDGSATVECWNEDTDDADSVEGDGGTWTLEVGLRPGSNTILCSTYEAAPQESEFRVVYEGTSGSSPTPPPGSWP